MKWHRKQISGWLVIMMTLFFAAGCSKSFDHSAGKEKQMKEEQLQSSETFRTENQETESLTTERADPQIVSSETQTAQLVDLIRAHLNDTFTGNHSLNDSFFQWFDQNYGQPALQSIAQELQNGNNDENLWYQLTGNSIQVLWSKYCQDKGQEDAAGGPVIWKQSAKAEETVIALTGDVNFAENYSTTRHLDADKEGISGCFSKDLLDDMKSADLLVMNNEFTISKRGEPVPGKTYTFRADPSRTSIYQELGTDLVSLGNNHAYDYGPEALCDTIDALDQAGVAHVGAGKNLNQAKTPVSYVINGRKITFVSATQIEKSTNYTKEATDTTPGVLKTLNPDIFCSVIAQASKYSDYVFVLVHWGTEGKSNFDADQLALAKDYQKAGADAVIGSHPHCLQGAAYVDQMPILFSMGNFWFNGKTMDTALAQIRIKTDGSFSVGMIPCRQSGLRTVTVTDAAARAQILQNLNNCSSDAEFDTNGILHKKS